MKRPPWVLYALLALLIFVLLHGFLPSDPRIRMGFKTFKVEWGVTPGEIWYAVKKWRHILWFALFFPLVRSLFRDRSNAKALACLVLVTIVIEFQQGFINGRHARIVDVLPNLMGAFVGAYAWRRLQSKVAPKVEIASRKTRDKF